MYLHPEDIDRPMHIQRIDLSGKGEAAEYRPRQNVWVALALAVILAIGWLIIFHYFGGPLWSFTVWLISTPFKK
jgi:hypothetical protein